MLPHIRQMNLSKSMYTRTDISVMRKAALNEPMAATVNKALDQLEPMKMIFDPLDS